MTPAQETAWLRDFAHLGAAIVTRNGIRTYEFLPVSFVDANGVTVSPLFPARERGGKRYTDTSTKPQID